MDVILARQPRSVLDIGCGWGKYGFLLREYLDQWERQVTIDAVEGFPGYLDRSPAHKIYDEIHEGGFPDVEVPGHFDLVLMIDVLEHFTPDDGAAAVARALELGDAVVICTPVGYEQGAEFGNDLEIHRSSWTETALKTLGHPVEFHRVATSDSVLAVLG